MQVETRSQAVAKMADNSSSQQTI